MDSLVSGFPSPLIVKLSNLRMLARAFNCVNVRIFVDVNTSDCVTTDAYNIGDHNITNILYAAKGGSAV